MALDLLGKKFEEKMSCCRRFLRRGCWSLEIRHLTRSPEIIINFISLRQRKRVSRFYSEPLPAPVVPLIPIASFRQADL